MDWYKHWFGTRYYALLYGHRDDADASAWVEAIAARWALPAGSAIMDMACGRGRHARHFAQLGLHVTGIDISESSIADARSSVPAAEFHVRDMRSVFWREHFDAICCLFTSLGYFETLDDDQQVFHAASLALKPGGFFTVDFMNIAVVLRDLVEKEELEREGIRFSIHRSLHDGVLVKRVTVEDGASIKCFEERVQALDHHAMAAMARKAGLEVIDITDGPVLAPFDPDRSQRFVLWTRKPLR